MTQQRRLATYLVPLFAALFFCACQFNSPPVADDIASMASVAALVERGTLAIPSLQWLDDQVGIGIKGPDGQLVSKYGIGQVLVAVPLYALGRLIPSAPYEQGGHIIALSSTGVRLAMLVNPFALFMLLWLVQRLVEEKWRMDGALAAAAVAFATPLFFTARTFGTEINTALFLCLAALCALRRRYAVGMLCIGVAALFRPSAIVFALAWPAFLLGRPWREWLGCALALGVGLLGLGLYNVARYGSLLQSGYAGASYFSLQMDGLLGFLISPGRALWVFAPIMLLLIPALRMAFKTHDAFALRLLPGLLAFYVLHALWHEWHGGWSYGPRLLVPILPLLAVILAPYLLRPAALPLTLAGLVIQLLSLFATPYLVIERALLSGITFEQTVWSLQANMLVLQAQAVWAELSVPRLVLIVAAGIGLTALYGYARVAVHKRTHQAKPA